MQATSGQARRRVVITGIGVIAPNGIGKERFWQACITGRSGIRRITRFDISLLPSQIAGEVPDFIPEDAGLTPEEICDLDRSTQFSIAAANLALGDAQILDVLMDDELLRERTGVIMGLAQACQDEGERQWAILTNNGRCEPTLDSQYELPHSMLMPHAAASEIASHHQLYGPNMVVATGCSSGADAIGQAFWTIEEGRADCMLAGGTDSAICYSSISTFSVMGALSTGYNMEPERASRPYDHKRDGFVMAEGAGVVLLEERERALARNAHIYAEILVFGSNSNAYHMTSLPPNGLPLQQLLQQVLAEGNIAPQMVDYINSHGSSTRQNEIAETTAYKAVFGNYAYRIPISATKSMLGHTQGAAGAIETLLTALILDRQQIPPTINLEYNDPHCDLDYVPNMPRHATVQIALTHSSGFGGVNSALVLSHKDWSRVA